MTFVFNFKTIDIESHLKQVCDLLIITAKLKGIKFICDFKDLPNKFTTDPNRL
jgi:hypothetical protein